jgi:hypothetical protein
LSTDTPADEGQDALADEWAAALAEAAPEPAAAAAADAPLGSLERTCSASRGGKERVGVDTETPARKTRGAARVCFDARMSV